MREYRHQIKSVFENGMRIGFIARRSAIIGWACDLPDGWMIIHALSYAPCQWWGNFKTRKEAVSALKKWG